MLHVLNYTTSEALVRVSGDAYGFVSQDWINNSPGSSSWDAPLQVHLLLKRLRKEGTPGRGMGR